MKRANTTRYFDEARFEAAMGLRGLPRPRKEPPDGWSRKAPNPMLMLKDHLHAHRLGQEEILRHTDRYRPQSYVSETVVRGVAEGPGGFVF